MLGVRVIQMFSLKRKHKLYTRTFYKFFNSLQITETTSGCTKQLTIFLVFTAGKHSFESELMGFPYHVKNGSGVTHFILG